MKNYYIYIVTNNHNTAVYTGLTNNLERRMFEHKNKLVKGFTTKYNLSKLIYFELTYNITAAISREKEIKKWRREKKNKLIETLNPNWDDLSKKLNDTNSNPKENILNSKGSVISNKCERSSFEQQEYLNRNLNNKISQSSEERALLRNDKRNTTGLLISAGLSSRMGKFKPLLEYKGNSFLINILEKLQEICESTIVVTGHNHGLIHDEIKKSDLIKNVKIVQNENYRAGMFSSLQAGLTEFKNKWILFHQIDQPNLPLQFYIDLKNRISGNFNWIQPVYNSRKGHPILFNQDVVKIIMQSDLSSNLREISNCSSINKMLWQCSQKEIHTDIDNQQDLNKLLES